MRYVNLSSGLCLVTLLLYTHLAFAAPLSLNFTPNPAKGGEEVTLSAAVKHAEIAETHADVYIAVQLPDGAMHYLAALQLEALAERNQIVPLLENWRISDLPETTLLTFMMPKLIPAGTYKWYITFAKVGTDVALPSNWLARISVSFTVTDTIPLGGSGKFEDDLAEFDLEDSLAAGDGSVFSSTVDAVPPSAPIPSPAPSVPVDESFADAEGVAGDDIAGLELPDIPSEPLPEPVSPQIPVQSGTLTAGDIDDNLNFQAFLSYLSREISNQFLPANDLTDRVTLTIQDEQGQAFSHAKVRITSGTDSAASLDTYAGSNGQLQLFPQFDGFFQNELNITLAASEDSFANPTTTAINLASLTSQRAVALTLPNATASLPNAVDIMLVIDATGSMGDEMRYLILELQDIIGNVQQQHPTVSMRFGLVVYRDEGDFYVVRDFPFTASLHDMHIQLSAQSAGGGGDYPEAMEQGLAAGLQADWRTGNVARLLFLIADAPPHDENLQTMLEQVKTARHMGVRIHSLAASGVAEVAEYMLRYASVLTQGRYLFLTDDSGVGAGHAEPKIACYVVTRLDKLMSRVISSELSGTRVEPTATDIVRQVGNYQNGLCAETGQQQ